MEVAEDRQAKKTWLQACAKVFQVEGNLGQEDAQIAAGTAWQLAGSRLDSDPVEAARTLIAEG